jgi:hypothetical protein
MYSLMLFHSLESGDFGKMAAAINLTLVNGMKRCLPTAMAHCLA